MGEEQETELGVCERKCSDVQETLKKLSLVSPDAIAPSLSHIDRTQDYCTYAVLQREGKEDRCYLDIPMDRTQPAEVSVGAEVTCLVISTATTLVLKAIPSLHGCYTRVGLFRPTQSAWSFETDRQSIFIQ